MIFEIVDFVDILVVIVVEVLVVFMVVWFDVIFVEVVGCVVLCFFSVGFVVKFEVIGGVGNFVLGFLELVSFGLNGVVVSVVSG